MGRPGPGTLLLSPPWRRAPFLLGRFPGVLLALVVATAVLGIAAASGPLFLSSTGSASLTDAALAGCPEQARPGLGNPAYTDLLAVRDGMADLHRPQDGTAVERGGVLVRAVMAQRGLPDPYRVLTYAALLRPGSDLVNSEVFLYSRPDMLAHVEVLDSGDGPGVWITDRYAGVRGLRVGDQLDFAFGSAPVAGVYRDLAGDGIGGPVAPYWCTWSENIVPQLEFRPPPFVLADAATLFSLVPTPEPDDDRFSPEIVAAWYSAVPVGGLSLADAEDVVRRSSDLDIAVTRLGQERAQDGSGHTRTDALPALVDAAARTRAGLVGPVVPVAVAATVVALLLLTAAGGLWVAQRSREVDLLRSRGVGGGWLGIKAGLEMLPAVLLGAVLGWALSIVLVRALGPSSLLEPGALRGAGSTVALAAGGGLLALTAVSAVGATRRMDPRSRPAFLRTVPWELALLAASWWVARAATGRTTPLRYGDAVSLDARLIVFPLLALCGGLLLAARIVGLLLSRLRRVSANWAPTAWLAARSLAGGVGVTLGVFVLAAVPLGVLAYSAGLTGSLQTTVSAKADVYNGADVALDLRAYAGVEPVPDVRGVGTVVEVVSAALVGDRRFGLLGVDPDTFGAFSAWREDLVGSGPAELLGALGPAGPDGAVPAILVGAPADTAVTEMRLFRTVIPVRVAARAPLFPGLRVPQPTLVVAREVLGDSARYSEGQVEVWTDDAHADALGVALGAQQIDVSRRRTPAGFLGRVDLVPVTWTFGYLETVAALTGLIAVTAQLLYLAVRQRQRSSAFHLGRRMGLTLGSHLRGLLLEVGVVLGGAWLVGSAVGLACVQLVYRRLDLNPTFPPPPVSDLPVGLLLTSGGAVLVAVVLTAVAAHVTARRTRAAAVLRLD